MNESVAFSQFVVKVHSRCDLACDICYVYEHADQSWRERSNVMSAKTARRTAERIAEHVVEQGVPNVHIILHGGEPLLAGVERLKAIIGEFRSVLDGVCAVQLAVHTNGTKLSPAFCDMFRANGVKVGVSLDGDRAANDRHRLYRDGRSSHDKVVRGIDLLREEYPDLYAGLLCTIDTANDPVAVYEALLAHRPPAVNFLLQHATWDTPPRRLTETDHADWLIQIFDRWHADGRTVRIGYFDSILDTLHGRASRVESLGLDPNDVVVIETDGEIEQTDSLKTAYDGAPDTGLNVFANSLAEAAAHPEVISRQRGLAGLPDTCQSCPVVRSCGGGLLAHRYSRERGFDNPSVYCPDLKKLITHLAAVPAGPRRRLTEFEALSAGEGGRAAAFELVEGQQSLQRVLVARLTRLDRDAREVLEQADLVSRESIVRVAAHPTFRAWAIDRLEGRTTPDRLPGFAAAVAVHARLDADLDLPVRDGEIHLPTIGSYQVGSGQDRLCVRIRQGRVQLEQPLQRSPRLTAGGLSLVLEDRDPDRGWPGWPVAAPLSAAEIAAWQKMLVRAWSVIGAEHPEHLDALPELLSTVIPLAAPIDADTAVGTHSRMFGAVALALPTDPRALAHGLVHGLQAMKLAAVQDLVDLHDRSDPAFADRLRSAYTAPTTVSRLAELAASPCLTPLGRRFLDGMTRKVRAPEPVR